MSIPRNLGNFADNVDTNGQVSLTTGVTGTLPVANGGTGLTATPTNGQLDIGNGTGFTRAAITQGTGVSVTNGSGSITLANTGVTSIVAGTGITISGATGAVTVNASGGGTVTSVATGNGLSGGTITTSGTLTLGDVGYNTVGSYSCGNIPSNVGTLNPGSTFAGSAFRVYIAVYNSCAGQTGAFGGTTTPSGTLRYMGAAGSYTFIAVRIS